MPDKWSKYQVDQPSASDKWSKYQTAVMDAPEPGSRAGELNRQSPDSFMGRVNRFMGANTLLAPPSGRGDDPASRLVNGVGSSLGRTTKAWHDMFTGNAGPMTAAEMVPLLGPMAVDVGQQLATPGQRIEGVSNALQMLLPVAGGPIAEAAERPIAATKNAVVKTSSAVKAATPDLAKATAAGGTMALVGHYIPSEAANVVLDMPIAKYAVRKVVSGINKGRAAFNADALPQPPTTQSMIGQQVVPGPPVTIPPVGGYGAVEPALPVPPTTLDMIGQQAPVGPQGVVPPAAGYQAVPPTLPVPPTTQAMVGQQVSATPTVPVPPVAGYGAVEAPPPVPPTTQSMIGQQIAPVDVKPPADMSGALPSTNPIAGPKTIKTTAEVPGSVPAAAEPVKLPPVGGWNTNYSLTTPVSAESASLAKAMKAKPNSPAVIDAEAEIRKAQQEAEGLKPVEAGKTVEAKATTAKQGLTDINGNPAGAGNTETNNAGAVNPSGGEPESLKPVEPKLGAGEGVHAATTHKANNIADYIITKTEFTPEYLEKLAKSKNKADKDARLDIVRKATLWAREHAPVYDPATGEFVRNGRTEGALGSGGAYESFDWDNVRHGGIGTGQEVVNILRGKPNPGHPRPPHYGPVPTGRVPVPEAASLEEPLKKSIEAVQQKKTAAAKPAATKPAQSSVATMEPVKATTKASSIEPVGMPNEKEVIAFLEKEQSKSRDIIPKIDDIMRRWPNMDRKVAAKIYDKWF